MIEKLSKMLAGNLGTATVSAILMGGVAIVLAVAGAASPQGRLVSQAGIEDVSAGYSQSLLSLHHSASTQGFVVAVDASRGTFAVFSTSKAVSVVKVDGKTLFNGPIASVANLRTGMTVAVNGLSQPDGSILATSVTVTCGVSASAGHGGHKHHDGSQSLPFATGSASVSGATCLSPSEGSSLVSNGSGAPRVSAGGEGNDEN